MAIRWNVDRHKYFSEVSRTALEVMAKRKITSQSALSAISDAEDEMADLGVYKNKQSAQGRISRALFTYFRSYGCIDDVENLTETGEYLVRKVLSVREFALHFMMNYECNGTYPFLIILELLSALEEKDGSAAFVVAQDITTLADAGTCTNAIVDEIRKRHKKGFDKNGGNDGSDVWIWLLRQTGILYKRKDKLLAVLNKHLARAICSLYEHSLFSCKKGKFEAGLITQIPLPLLSGSFKTGAPEVFISFLRAFLFFGVDNTNATKFLPSDTSSNVEDALDALGLSEKYRGMYSSFVGYEHLIGCHLLSQQDPGLKEIGQALVDDGEQAVKYVEIPQQEEVDVDKKEASNGTDRLDISLQLFAESRKTEAWCAEAVGGDATKPGMGWLANVALRKTLPMTNNLGSDAQVKAWFKDLVWPNGQEWLAGVDTTGCAAWGSTIDGLVSGNGAVEGGAPTLPGRIVAAVRAVAQPDTECFYDANVFEALKFLGLADGVFTEDFSDDDYAVAKGAQAVLKRRLRDLGEKCAVEWDAAATPPCANPDAAPPDYLTVNEFLWWVKENQNLVKEKVMSLNLKKVNSADRVKKGGRPLADAFKDEMMQRLAAALRTKPFAILAGHSGTGKSQLVRRLAYMTCNNEDLIQEGVGKTAPGNYCMVQVKPNWHDSSDLLGYYSDLNGRHFVNTPFLQFLCKAYAYPETPFFLCLDEMNLAPVEQYFAEYLSAVESLEPRKDVWLSDPLVEVARTNSLDASGKPEIDRTILEQIMQGAPSVEAKDWIVAHGVTIPKNLFVVGTVNMDETTCQFSRKVLDRAMTILMNDAKFADMSKTPEPSQEQLLDPNGIAFFLSGERQGFVGPDEAKLLDQVNESLANTPFIIAYRFANEYALYEEALANLEGVVKPSNDAADTEKEAYRTKVSAKAEAALDQVVLMKLLPRIHGMRDVVKGIFEGRKVEGKEIPGLKTCVTADGKSAKMMAEIVQRGDEYLTFWP